LVALALVLGVRDAHAYLDPGSGSYFIQILLAGLVGAAFAIRQSWMRIRSLFGRILSRRHTPKQ
jgi:hypothetical protein